MECPECGYEDVKWNDEKDDVVVSDMGRFFKTIITLTRWHNEDQDSKEVVIVNCPSCNHTFFE